jgi:SAM-dependent methyltransferase
MRIYRELAAKWYRLLDPLADHLGEATCYRDALHHGIASGSRETLLELGSGAGNNAFYLKRDFRCSLVDVSPHMQALSREVNPECEHERGDMRTVRLGRAFDAVFVHDAVMYVTTEQELRAVAETAFVHTRPGGAALFAPDCVTETFEDKTDLVAGETDGRSLRCLVWAWDPDPNDQTFVCDYLFALREHGEVTIHHDRHLEGLFPRETWHRVLGSVGFQTEGVQCTDDGETFEQFLCRRAR